MRILVRKKDKQRKIGMSFDHGQRSLLQGFIMVAGLDSDTKTRGSCICIAFANQPVHTKGKFDAEKEELELSAVNAIRHVVSNIYKLLNSI